jgi:hypothetical protein
MADDMMMKRFDNSEAGPLRPAFICRRCGVGVSENPAFRCAKCRQELAENMRASLPE